MRPFLTTSTHQRAQTSKFNALFLILFAFAFARLNAQTNTVYFEDWVKSGGSSPSQTQNEFLERVATVTDANGNLFTASSTYNANTQVHDLLLEKSNSSGSLVWSTQTNIVNGGDVLVGDLVLDATGALVFTGAVLKGSNSYDALTVKFTDAGAVSWNATWNGAANGYDGGASLVTDASGNIYVSGISTTSSVSRNFLTIKYTSSGTQSWVSQYDHAGLVDAAAKVTHDSGIIRVFGGVQVNSTTWAVSYVRYNAGTGAQISAGLISDNVVLSEINGFTTDASENIYIAGARNTSSNGYDFLTLKLNADLTVAWEATWNGTGAKDVAKAIATDANGNVYVSGYTTTSSNGKNYATLKYKPDGTFLWSKTYDGAAQLDDQATDVEVDGTGNIFVTGFANEKGNEDYVTIWYDTDGTEKWVGRFNSVYNRKDKSASLLIDEEGGLLVTGRTTKVEDDGSLNTETTTVRYDRSCDYIIPPDAEPQSSATVYVQNKGQLLKTNGSPASDVAFYTEAYSPWLTFQEDRINLTTTQLNGGGSDNLHRVDMAFGGTSRNRKLFALEQRKDYFNFYYAHIPQGREFVPLYQRLVYCEAFEGVDLEMSSNTGGAKYYYIVKPNQNPANIRLDFTGQSGLSIVGGDLKIGTSLGDVIMPEGTAYEVTSGGTKIPLNWTPSYVLNGASMSFSIGTYNPSNYLVIEVAGAACDDFSNQGDNLRWATFYEQTGETDAEFYHDISDDGSNVFVCGETKNTAFPVTTGLGIGSFGSRDAFNIKFDLEGRRKWTLKMGGTLEENAFAVFADANGNSYLGGKTTSTNFPDDDDGLDWFSDNLSGGAQDAFIAKFNPSGQRVFASYFGTADLESASVITQSSSGKFYVAGAGGVPAKNTDSSPMAVQPGGGAAFIARFSSDFKTHEWSSQYGLVGGNADVLDMETDAQGNVFITGVKGTSSVEVVGTGAVSYQGGGTDAFLAKIKSPPHELLWSSNYGGTSSETAHGLAVDSDGEIFICGETNSPSIPVFGTTGSLIGGFDGFTAKFSNSMSVIKSGYFSRNANDKLFDVAIGCNENVYFIGETSSSDLGAVAPSSYFKQSAIGSSGGINTDIVFLSNNNAMTTASWKTYMGGTPNETGTALTAMQGTDKLFFTGNTGFTAQVTFPLRPNITTGGASNISYFDCTAGSMPITVDGIIGRFDLDFVSAINAPSPKTKPFKLFPNPTSATLNFKSDLAKPAQVQVFSATGVEAVKSVWVNPYQDAVFDLSQLPKGAYWVRIVTDTEIFSQTLIIQ